jgi:hypothetical protein
MHTLIFKIRYVIPLSGALGPDLSFETTSKQFRTDYISNGLYHYKKRQVKGCLELIDRIDRMILSLFLFNSSYEFYLALQGLLY